MTEEQSKEKEPCTIYNLTHIHFSVLDCNYEHIINAQGLKNIQLNFTVPRVFEVINLVQWFLNVLIIFDGGQYKAHF